MSREVAELAALIDRLERGGVRLIALDVGLDTATPTGRLAVERRPARDLPGVPAEVPDEDALPDAPPEAAAEPVPDVAAPAPEIAPVPAPSPSRRSPSPSRRSQPNPSPRSPPSPSPSSPPSPSSRRKWS